MTYKQRATLVHVEDYKQNVVLKLFSINWGYYFCVG